jgi:hypothetical protein
VPLAVASSTNCSLQSRLQPSALHSQCFRCSVAEPSACALRHVLISIYVTLSNTVALLLRYYKQRTIRQKLTPRHVPAEVIAIADIPYTRSGKKVEVAVTRAIHGEKVSYCHCAMLLNTQFTATACIAEVSLLVGRTTCMPLCNRESSFVYSTIDDC